MKNKLEQLLNNLIEKGRKPRGYECGEDNGKRIHYHKKRMRYYYAERGYKRGDAYPEKDYKIRELVSKEGGLWQFVCENGMINIPGYKNIIRQGVDTKRHKYYGKDYRYWLCESSLKDESELEDFLLQNIKVGNED